MSFTKPMGYATVERPGYWARNLQPLSAGLSTQDFRFRTGASIYEPMTSLQTFSVISGDWGRAGRNRRRPNWPAQGVSVAF